MTETGHSQKPQMEHPSMLGTLQAQAAMVWPLERPILERCGVPQAERLADLGTGSGQFACRLAEAYPSLEVHGLDIYDGHVAEAKRLLAEANLSNLAFHHGDARHTPWKGSSFDAVTVRHMLHALEQPRDVLLEAKRLLIPGGLLYVLAEDYAGLIFDSMTPNEASLFVRAAPGVLEKGTNLLHGRATYRALLDAGFQDVRVDPIVVDTINSDRETFAKMLRHWRDGYASFLADALGCPTGDVVRQFDSLMLTVLDTDRYACWLLFAVTGRRPPH